MSTDNPKPGEQFIQITSGTAGLCALDAQGRVWLYVPGREGDGARPTTYAYWDLMTNERGRTVEGEM